MAKNFDTCYRHKDGPVVISQGIGDTLWGVFVLKPNGSLRRFKPIRMCSAPKDAFAALGKYTGKALKRVA